MWSFRKTFQNTLIYPSTSNVREDMKFYNLGDKSFETDFSIAQLIVFHAIYDQFLVLKFFSIIAGFWMVTCNLKTIGKS